ncbi:DUF2461 domain-containing protein [Flavobacterium agrisoli]|uniref:DUF2461 domain-containing protein n=1 Tax=Flavobacterium agrisoli TaxID=2793066 RepID=A0A934PMG8_9FLAO|nr:DUF2461 domain-containing protein [Flavobacterium agrisoli]MBK0370237.1 DUF2461 domain-containing protein [Flavobacterium agrisoli]
MIKKSTYTFLKSLRANNSKEFMIENRDKYDDAMADFTNFTQRLIDEISLFDNEIGRADLKAKDCIPRLNRDLRFSKNKAPYKTYLYSIICRKGRKVNDVNYGVFIDPESSFIYSGAWQPEPTHLKEIRSKINYDYNEWIKIAEDQKLLNSFPDGVIANESLKRMPAGYDEDNPAAKYLKMKGFVVKKQLDNSFFQEEKNWTILLNDFKVCTYLKDFLKKEE